MTRDSEPSIEARSVAAGLEPRINRAGAEDREAYSEVPEISGWWNYVDPAFRQQNN